MKGVYCVSARFARVLRIPLLGLQKAIFAVGRWVWYTHFRLRIGLVQVLAARMLRVETGKPVGDASIASPALSRNCKLVG